MINFLESWEKYLFARLERVKIVEDIGYLYEEFVSQKVSHLHFFKQI
jgi:hypothetical protein